MIYCVVPEPLAEELLGPLSDYYADNDNVTVIVNRRRSDRRARGSRPDPVEAQRRVIRDRRRARVAGELPALATIG